MITQINEQFMLGTHAERMTVNPASVPNGIVFYETDTKESAIALDGIWEGFAPGSMSGALFGHATILAGQDHIDVPIPGLTSAADPLVSIYQGTVDATLKSVQADVPAPGTLRILGNTTATANVKASYLIPKLF